MISTPEMPSTRLVQPDHDRDVAVVDALDDLELPQRPTGRGRLARRLI